MYQASTDVIVMKIVMLKVASVAMVIAAMKNKNLNKFKLKIFMKNSKFPYQKLT